MDVWHTGTTTCSNLLLIQRIQNKILCIMTNITNNQLYLDLEIGTVVEACKRQAESYIDRLHSYPNCEAIQLLDTINHTCRLTRNYIF